MKLLLQITMIALWCSQLFAAPVTIRSNSYVGISSDLYKDIQIDSNLDGKADLRYLENGTTKILLEYRNSTKSITVSRDIGEKRVTLWLTQNGKTTVLKRSVTSIPKVLYYAKDRCNDTKSLLDKIADLKEVTSVSADKVQYLVDESCDPYMSGEFASRFLSAVAATVSNEKDALLMCISSDSFQKSLDPKAKESMNLLSAKMELNYFEIQNQQTLKPLFFCGEDLGSETKGAFKGGHASYRAGKIQLNLKKGVNTDEKTLREVLQHEYLHHSGEEDEKTVKAIVDACEKKSSFSFSKEDGENNRGINPAGTKLNAETINAKEDPAGMKAAAETLQAAPTQAESSPTNMARVIDSGGESKALEVSRNQTSGIFAAANNLMGMMQNPAVAGTSGTAAGTASASAPSSRSVASTGIPTSYKPRVNTANAGHARNGETIVENIEVNHNRAAASQKQNESAAKSRSAPTANDVSSETVEIANSTSSQSSNRSSGRTSLSPGSSTSPSGKVRRPSNVSRGGSPGETDSGVNEYVTYITKNSYSQTKLKLRDPNFVRKLKDASISIIDLKGGVIGASRGNVILLDQGDRFVPQN